MFGTLAPGAALANAALRMADVVRSHFRLDADTVVLVSELACDLPGCPPLETVIAFWTAPGMRHHCKVFKPLQQVQVDDLPPWWMRDALVVPPDWVCECC